MPRIAKSESGGSTTADRTLALLGAFQTGDSELPLAVLAKRTGLYKSTSLRLLASLQQAGFLRRGKNGLYSLGPQITRLHAIRASQSLLERLALPILDGLVRATEETAALHVVSGSGRIRLCWVDSPRSVREHIQLGEVLPLDKGAGGKVLMAFAGVRGRGMNKIRREGFASSVGERVAELSGISAPVFDASGGLVGALTLTMPVHRYAEKWRGPVVQAAHELTAELGGDS
ncbi:MAG TPA: IclR family transcriptional regulator [Acidobacteriaceae bacterium]